MALATRKRQKISAPCIDSVDDLQPMGNVEGIAGVRVYDVGQGDAIALLDHQGWPFLWVDYGGRQGCPFSTAFEADARLPVSKGALLMLTHWDEDHWCSAALGGSVRDAFWLVPRQITSPRAVRLSTTLPRIRCIPPDCDQVPHRFRASNGDEVWWEKIGESAPAGASYEDCNRSGVALAIVNRSNKQVILLPGDAPFDRVQHYQRLREKYFLRGFVAFHHGAGTHWRRTTHELIGSWPRRGAAELVYSCASPNSYDHPVDQMYVGIVKAQNRIRTSRLRRNNMAYHDILF